MDNVSPVLVVKNGDVSGDVRNDLADLFTLEAAVRLPVK